MVRPFTIRARRKRFWDEKWLRPGRRERLLWSRLGLALQLCRISVRQTWRQAARERRLFLISTTYSFATRRSVALCRTLGVSRISQRFPRPLTPAAYSLSTLVRATW